jgi:hypothetical protein
MRQAPTLGSFQHRDRVAASKLVTEVTIPPDGPRTLFQGRGSMTYPEGALEFRWDGRGTTGPSAECLITSVEVRLKPKVAIRRILGWPELVLPRPQIRRVEKVLFGRYRFRLDNELLDGACFRPIGSEDGFLAALSQLRIPVIELPKEQRLAFELRKAWNQIRWGGRGGRRKWRKSQVRADEDQQSGSGSDNRKPEV